MATPRKPRRKDGSGAARRPAGSRKARKSQPASTSQPEPGFEEAPSREPVEAHGPATPTLAAERARRARPAVIFEALATLLAPYAYAFEAEMHDRMGYCLKTYGEWPTEVYFAGVQWTEQGLFFHLFPIAGHPEIVAGLSPELLKHRQGRVSFHFQTFETPLFAELARATAHAYQILVQEGTFGYAQAA